MGLENYRTSPTNPNDDIGGGGCLCHPEGKAVDCKGPYITFPAAELYSGPNNASPHAVICQTCVTGAAQAIVGADDTTTDYQAAQIDAQPEATVEWTDLSDEDRARVAWAPGSLVRLDSQRIVLVPEDITPIVAVVDPGGSDPSDVRPENVASLERFSDPDPDDVARDNATLANIDKEEPVIEV